MGLLSGIEKDAVSELALRKAITVEPSSSVRQVVKQMREGGLGCAIVVADDGKPIGIFNEAMLRHLLIESPAALDGEIQSVMATPFPWVRATDTVETVLEAMETKNSRFVVVLDDDGKPCGLTGQKGLMEYIADYFPGEVMVQRVGTKPIPESREGA